MDDDDVLLDDGRVYADVLRDLATRLREAFVAQYTGRERMFALSLASGRPEDCVKDIQRGRLTLERALEILDTADDYGVPTAVARRLIAAACF